MPSWMERLLVNSMIDYEKFQQSLKRLEEQQENYRTLDASLSQLTKEGIAESVVRRFKVCYDCLWKVLKRYLIEGLGIVDLPNSPKPVFKMAFENGMFAAPLEDWLNYADQRIDMTHDYSGEKANACLEITGDFIDDAIGLYQTMTEETWD